MFDQIGTIDKLIIYNVPIKDITYDWTGDFIGYEKLIRKIKIYGIKTPLVLYKDNNELKICDGYHRWYIAKMLNISHVPAVIFNSLKECHPTEHLKW